MEPLRRSPSRNRPCWPLLALLLAAAVPAAHAAGDPKIGIDVFSEQCAECHSVREGKNKKGPSLFAVLGRPSGSVPDFVYSDAMKSAHLTWTPEELDAYLTSPKQKVPGDKMKFDGLPDAKDRADLIAYLATLK